MVKALLFSNSTMPGTPFFTWPKPYVKEFLGAKVKELVFIPFAAVTISWDEYEQKVKEAFNEMGYKVKGIQHFRDKSKALEKAGGIVIGGGNTFALLNELYKDNLIVYVRDKVLHGMPYIGWSAGSNVACPTIMTTNDMPVVYPPSFESLELLPFQINPHYHELNFEGQGGETRKERLEEFMAVNPSKKVIGLPEGMLLRRDADQLVLKGSGVAKLYQHKQPILDLKENDNLSYLLNS
jgi:dipeptidase E